MELKKDETTVSFFTNISQVKDKFTNIRVMVDEYDLIQSTIYGLPSSWEKFLVVVNGREVKPNFDRMQHDFLQEEG